MADWTKSMHQTYEYYVVDPDTWANDKKIETVRSSSINRDSEVETKGSATIDLTESLGECYVRTVLKTNQNGVEESHPLGTHLIQTPSFSFNGMVKTISADAYTPLIELKEKQPPLGYFIDKGENIMDWAYRLVREHARAPVVKTTNDTKLDNVFIADPEDTWLSFITSLIANAKFEIDVNELGQIIFPPKQDIASLQPVCTYNDNNSSILYADIDITQDLYSVPNVVEVICSTSTSNIYVKVVNDDPNSPISTVNRGREIPYRETNPDIFGGITKARVEEYATQLLRNLSTLEKTVKYTHGYCDVRVGDCVRLNYERAGLNDVKARVISQDIDCKPGCVVKETAVITTKLWGDVNGLI